MEGVNLVQKFKILRVLSDQVEISEIHIYLIFNYTANSSEGTADDQTQSLKCSDFQMPKRGPALATLLIPSPLVPNS